MEIMGNADRNRLPSSAHHRIWRDGACGGGCFVCSADGAAAYGAPRPLLCAVPDANKDLRVATAALGMNAADMVC